MYQNLINYIENYSGLEINCSEIELIKSKFHPKTLRKRQYLLKAGKLSKYTAFITMGAMRQFCVDDKGNEKIVQPIKFDDMHHSGDALPGIRK